MEEKFVDTVQLLCYTIFSCHVRVAFWEYLFYEGCSVSVLGGISVAKVW